MNVLGVPFCFHYWRKRPLVMWRGDFIRLCRACQYTDPVRTGQKEG